MCPLHPETPFLIPPQPTPLGCPRAPALAASLHALNLHWASTLHMVLYVFQCYSAYFIRLFLPALPNVCLNLRKN